MLCDEFSLITHYFDRSKTSHLDVEIGIGDDCALLNIPKNQTLAISTDTLVCNRHFLPEINPADLAYKALAVNISDLAAMGADPVWLMLALTLPKIDEAWLEAFSCSLFKHLSYYHLHLIGGDVTTGPLSLTITIYGYVPVGKALKRTGAKPGDSIYVTGTLGDSAAGLAILQKKLTVDDLNDATWLVNRHLHPSPRISHGLALRNCASSAIDLSDGLISNLSHILKASKVGALIDLNLLPFSIQMSKHVELKQILYWALYGGEDYELCFTVPETRLNTLDLALTNLGIKFTHIGKIVLENEGLKLVQNGFPSILDWKGYNHFT